MAATHTSALTMVDNHSRDHTKARLPRATIYTPREFRLEKDMEGWMMLVSSYGFYFESRQSGIATLFAWTFTIFALHYDEAFQGFFFSCKTQLRRLARASHWLPLSSGTYSLALYLLGTCIHHPVSMVRKHGRPRRGSAWDAHKA
jgi:hypothetical protein